MIQNARGILLGHGTLKSAASQGLIDVKSWFFACWYKFRKFKNYFNDYWVGIVKSEWDLLDHETLKSGVLHKWFTELSRLIEWYLHADSDGIIFVLIVQYSSYIWRLMLEVHKMWLSVKIGNCPKPRYSSSAWLSTSTISKFCYPSYMVIISYNFTTLMPMSNLCLWVMVSIKRLLQMPPPVYGHGCHIGRHIEILNIK